MKERLVEDWLIRINERGYEVSFCQTLLSGGHRIIRCGHSPTEHGKDVLTIAPDGDVCAYQLKTGDFSQAEIGRHLTQISMLVEARPTHPGLPADFNYRPFLVTTGEYKDPAVSLVKELNAGWQHRGLPPLTLVNGRQLLGDFIALSSDFWPIETPAVRQFRELYLADGRGDLDLPQLARFLIDLLRDVKSGLDLERRVAAANLFASYLLGEFYNRKDHWSVIRGWTVCAAQIAWTGIVGNHERKHWGTACEIARNAAMRALEELRDELLSQGAFAVNDRELDDFTRTRNTVALAAAACSQLMISRDSQDDSANKRILELAIGFVQQGRLFFWGEGAWSQFLMLIWFLERNGQTPSAQSVLMGLIEGVAKRNAKFALNPFEDPYASPDECLLKLFGSHERKEATRREAIESYSLLSMVTLATRRGLRNELAAIWPKISRVDLSVFRPDSPTDALLWQCAVGKEHAQSFSRPQRWKDLQELAFRDDQKRVPMVLRDDIPFALLFLLVYQHRMLISLMKHLDDHISASEILKRPNA